MNLNLFFFLSCIIIDIDLLYVLQTNFFIPLLHNLHDPQSLKKGKEIPQKCCYYTYVELYQLYSRIKKYQDVPGLS